MFPILLSASRSAQRRCQRFCTRIPPCCVAQSRTRNASSKSATGSEDGASKIPTLNAPKKARVGRLKKNSTEQFVPAESSRPEKLPRTKRRKTSTTDNSSKPKTRRKTTKIDESINKKVIDSGDDSSTTVFSKRIRGTQSITIPGNLRDNLQAYLKWTNGGTIHGKPIGDARRMNIVSESLCDDILDRLKPSLQKHVGCDIIDLNPGAGLWSTKIHDYLQPRSHILLEPDQEAYAPLLQPLVDSPGSKYKLVYKSGIIWPHLESILNREYLPFQENLKAGDPRLDQPNDSLLVIANLGFYPKKIYRGFPSLASLVFYQLMSAIRTHSLFQRYGLVRMLIWAEDSEKTHLLPRSIARRGKSDVEAEAICHKITEVASSTDYLDTAKGIFLRPFKLDLEGMRQVNSRMENSGIRTPEGRQSLLMKELADFDAGISRGQGATVNFLNELKQMEELYAAGKIPPTITTKDQHGKSKAVRNPVYKTLALLRSRAKHRFKGETIRDDLVEELETIFAVQSSMLSSRDGSEEQVAQLAELQKRTAVWKNRIDELGHASKITVGTTIDNILTFKLKPAALLWDRRETEPLRVKPKEFYPEKPMCLFDIQPQQLWPVFRENPPDSYEAFEYIVGQLFITPAHPLPKALTGLYPSAFEWLVSECPSLTDPTKGGSLDVSLMTVRRLTADMIKEMVEAWMRWPFRPTRYELLLRSGSESFDPDAFELELRE